MDFLRADLLREGSDTVLEEALRTADWERFEAKEHLVPLRERLARIERERGVTELHRFCSAALAPKATLHARRFHRAGLSCFGLSPCGRWLATGDPAPHDDFEAGGRLLVWELATGRCVRTFEVLFGGVGWQGSRGCLQWRPDGKRIGAIFGTNCVGVFDPFGAAREHETLIDVTRGWDSPPAWCWMDDSRVIVSAWGPNQELVCVAPTAPPGYRERDPEVRWIARPPSPTMLELDGMVVRASDGLLLGHDAHGHVHAVDLEAGDFAWSRTYDERVRPWFTFHPPLEWAPNGAGFVHWVEGEASLHRDGVDTPTGVSGAGIARWSAEGQRVAISGERNGRAGIHVFVGGEPLCSLDTGVQRADWHLPDALPLAWSRDGALLCSVHEGAVSVYQIAAEPRRLARFDTWPSACGVEWGDARLVVISRHGFDVWDARGQTRVARQDFLAPAGRAMATPLTSSPFVFDPREDGLEIPVATEDGWSFIGVSSAGPVLIPRGTEEHAREALSLVFEDGLAWPWSWVEGCEAFPVHRELDTFASAVAEVEVSGGTWRGPFRKAPLEDAVGSEVEVPCWPPERYHADPLLLAPITAPELEAYRGKVVLFAKRNDLARVELATVVEVGPRSIQTYTRRGGATSTWSTALDDLAWIGPAVPWEGRRPATDGGDG